MKSVLKLLFIFSLIEIILTTENKKPRVIIIGSGPSGVAAGTKLLENDFEDILILEAENRIGGRINTVSFGKNVVDMGGQWCHGEEKNVVFELAWPLGLLEHSDMEHYNHSFVLSNGEFVQRKISSKLEDLCDEIMDDPDIAKFDGSFGEFAVNYFHKALKHENYTDVTPEIGEKFLDYCHKYSNLLDAADSWFDVSAKSYFSFEESEGDEALNWKGKGYKTILDILMKKIPDPSQDLKLEEKIKLNKAVKTVDYSHDDKVVVTCEDGDTFEADHVITTVSLGVLKEKHESLFIPALPEKKIKSIEAISIGTVDKLYLEFSEPFWNADWKGFTLLWNSKELEEVKKREDNWIQDIVAFHTVEHQPNLLCGWIFGPNARKMESLPEQQVLQSVLSVMRIFLKDVPEPINFKRSTWHSNPHFRGSYSHPSLLVDSLNVSNADLAEPVLNKHHKPVLLFAGEATSSNHYSTVHGAIETGWREADRIIFLTKNKN